MGSWAGFAIWDFQNRQINSSNRRRHQSLIISPASDNHSWLTSPPPQVTQSCTSWKIWCSSVICQIGGWADSVFWSSPGISRFTKSICVDQLLLCPILEFAVFLCAIMSSSNFLGSCEKIMEKSKDKLLRLVAKKLCKCKWLALCNWLPLLKLCQCPTGLRASQGLRAITMWCHNCLTFKCKICQLSIFLKIVHQHARNRLAQQK